MREQLEDLKRDRQYWKLLYKGVTKGIDKYLDWFDKKYGLIKE